MIYRAVKGSNLSDEDAQIIGEQIGAIVGSGSISAESVVEEASPAYSPLHPYFEWDDSRAAFAYRCDQARHMIRSVLIVRQDATEPVRAFHVVTHANGVTGYTALDVIIHRPELLSQIIEEARRELAGWERRYSQYEALAPQVQIIRQMVEALVPA